MAFARIILFLSLLFHSIPGYNQTGIVDPRDDGMGNATVAATPPYGITTNIALLNSIIKDGATISSKNKYSIKDLLLINFSFSKIISENTALLGGIGRIGNNQYSEQFFEAGISKKLTKQFSGGVKIKYYQWITSDSYYDNSHAFIPEIGLFIQPFKKVSFGAVIRNPVRVRMNAIEREKLPAEINAGLSTRISEKILLAFAAIQKSTGSPGYHVGIEYLFHPVLTLRMGIITEPATQTFGIGLRLNKSHFDVGIQMNPVLGNTTSAAFFIDL